MHLLQRHPTCILCAVGLALGFGGAACGDSAAFGGPGGPSGSGGTATGTTTLTTSSGGGGAGASTQGGSAPGGAGGQGNEGGTGTGTTGGAGPGGSAPVLVDCDGSSCPAGPQGACCWDQYQAYGAPRGECVTGTNESDDCTTSQTGEGWETRIECQLPSDCPGAICCGDWKQGYYQGQQYSYYEDLTCQPTCEYPSLWICDPAAPPTEDCPLIPNGTGGTVQSVCEPSQLLPPGYYVCGMP